MVMMMLYRGNMARMRLAGGQMHPSVGRSHSSHTALSELSSSSSGAFDGDGGV